MPKEDRPTPQDRQKSLLYTNSASGSGSTSSAGSGQSGTANGSRYRKFLVAGRKVAGSNSNSSGVSNASGFAAHPSSAAGAAASIGNLHAVGARTAINAATQIQRSQAGGHPQQHQQQHHHNNHHHALVHGHYPGLSAAVPHFARTNKLLEIQRRFPLWQPEYKTNAFNVS